MYEQSLLVVGVGGPSTSVGTRVCCSNLVSKKLDDCNNNINLKLWEIVRSSILSSSSRPSEASGEISCHLYITNMVRVSRLF